MHEATGLCTRNCGVGRGMSCARGGEMGTWDQALDALYASGPRLADVQSAQARLRARLRAPEAKVFYDVLGRSPLGTVYLAAGESGLIAVGLATDERSFARRVTRTSGTTPVRSAARLHEARRQMQEYLSGTRTSFDLKIDLRGTTPFQRSVLEAARRIPRGAVLTYGDLAVGLAPAECQPGGRAGAGPQPAARPYPLSSRGLPDRQTARLPGGSDRPEGEAAHAGGCSRARGSLPDTRTQGGDR